jgi:hypothetical protein
VPKAEPSREEPKPDDAKAKESDASSDSNSAGKTEPLNRSEVGKLGAEARWRKERERKMAEVEARDEPESEMKPKAAPAEDKTERPKGGPQTDVGGLLLGLALGAVFLVLLWAFLGNRNKGLAPPKVVDTTATPVKDNSTPKPEPQPMLEPSEPSRFALPDDNPYESVLGPHGKLR